MMTEGSSSPAAPDEGAAQDDEPDYRFTLANERTFLAWIRTSFGLLAGGVAVEQLVEPSGARTVIAVCCLLLAITLAAGAYGHWRKVQQAMRRAEPLPGFLLIPILAAGTSVIALVAAVMTFLS